jgi:maleamate amidohydrolase
VVTRDRGVASDRPKPHDRSLRDFEDHCWRGVVPPEVLEIYAPYRRQVFVGERPALLAVDLYELAYQGGARPVRELVADYPSSCGEHAWAAIEPTRRLLDAARAAGVPIFYSTRDTAPHGAPERLRTTRRRATPVDASLYRIRDEFSPRPGDVVIHKSRASAFFGTPLSSHLTELRVDSVIVCGETTSGCVRATAVDAHSHGYHVVVVEECCFDRSLLSHQVNLFDLHHKYADVMVLEEVVEHLEALARRGRGR